MTENYEITYQPGTLTIEPSPVTLTFNDQTIAYGEAPAKGKRKIQGRVEAV